ncbi:MAG: uncharacterized protein JWM68_1228 [Verrucomicrobiales bacterium]|nr:uncharacterized protein [Verrucomicrobiales bacterium]
MKFSPDDPKLTAYVLGELDKTEAAAIEQELKNSAELRQAVDEIRATAEFLKTEFATEEKLSLSAQQKQTIAAELPPTNLIPMPKRKIAVFVSISAIAAAVMFILTWGFRFTSTEPKLATNPSPYKYAQNAEQAKRNELAAQKNAEGEKAPGPAVQPADVHNTAQGQEAVQNSTKLAHDGQLLFEMGKLDQAEGKLREAKKLNADSASAQYYLNLIEERRFRRSTADHELVEKQKIVDVAKEWNEPLGRQTLPSSPPLTQNHKVIPPTTTGNRVIVLDETAGVFPSTGNANPTPSQKAEPSLGLEAGLNSPDSASVAAAAGVSVNGSLASVLPSTKSSDYYGLGAGKQDPNVATASGRSHFGSRTTGDLNGRGEAERLAIRKTGAATTTLGSKNAKEYAFGNRVVQLGDDQRGSIVASTRGFYDDGVEDFEVPVAAGKIPTRSLRQKNYDRSGTARYPQYIENAFESVVNAPLSTVSIDVDTASYANVRRFLSQNQMPPRDAVRVEELINYFTYSYPQPQGSDPFSVNMEVAGCPWNKEHRLVRVGLKGKEMAQDKRPPSNFVFLIDVSGSMSPSERLPLIKQALRMLVKKMTENDRIGIVVYAGNAGVVLESTSCVNKEKILEALDRLEAGGSTNGGDGIEKAYALAEENFIKGGVNRVILATDGDFNVGISDQNALVNLIQKKAKSGVFLSALGVGTDNYKDALMQKLADKGNGNYHYLDTLEEAQKVLIQQMNGTLVTIAKDVKIQIEFNPAQVQSYRLIGYEKRIMEAQDFNNDKKDAGEIGAGHTVTALYEIVPTGVDEEEPRPAVDDLKYQSKPRRITPKTDRREPRSDDSNELLTLKLRFKKPDGDTSKLIEFPLHENGKKFSNASTDFRFATAVAGFGMLLKDSEYRGNIGYDQVRELAEGAKGDDKEGYRSEFINLVKKAKSLDRNRE